MPLWGLAFASLCCLLTVGGIYWRFVRGNEGTPERYLAQVISVTAGDELLAATELDADGLKVLWIDGLEQLPKEYELE